MVVGLVVVDVVLLVVVFDVCFRLKVGGSPIRLVHDMVGRWSSRLSTRVTKPIARNYSVDQGDREGNTWVAKDR
jgi:hypothetical protein